MNHYLYEDVLYEMIYPSYFLKTHILISALAHSSTAGELHHGEKCDAICL